MKIRTTDASQVHIDEATLLEVDKFSYLECKLGKDGDIQNEVGIRIVKASSAFRDLSKVRNEDGISLQTKLKIFNSIVVSILTYVCESWKGLKEIEERLRCFENGCLRKILKISWFDRVGGDEHRRRIGQRSILEELEKCRWRWYGHVLRMSDQRIPKHAMHWKPA